MKLEISRQIFEKPKSIKFHQNLFSGSWLVSYGHRVGRTHRSTDMFKTI